MLDHDRKPDPSSCDQEPIHQLGMIQPFGFLIAVSSDWIIECASDNVGIYACREAQALVGTDLGQLFSRSAMHELRNKLTQMTSDELSERVFGVALLTNEPAKHFDCSIYRADGLIVIEAEPSNPIASAEAAGLLRAINLRLDATIDLAEFWHQGARTVQVITGFDRVMVYRFGPNGSGEVVAESKRSGVRSFFGLHFPASDIPQQARALYRRNPFRIISDVDAHNSVIVSRHGASTFPLDLSLSVLRAVSPTHIQYLKNMAVKASLSISVIVDGELWGMIACHNEVAKRLSFDLRTIVELFGQTFSLRLESRLRRGVSDQREAARVISDHILTAATSDVGLLRNPEWLIQNLKDICRGDGICAVIDGQVASSGLIPDAQDMPNIITKIQALTSGKVFFSDQLCLDIPEASCNLHALAGILAIPISLSPNDYFMIFRQERLRNITWAGDPNKSVHIGGQDTTLSPRISFESWCETVRGRSEPFTFGELTAAEALRTSIVDVALRLSRGAYKKALRPNT